MATVLQRPSVTVPPLPLIPPLQNGDRLTRAEFERRYTAMPEVKKAELIEGEVFMASPVHLDHSVPHATVMGWLFVYRSITPGITVADNGTVRLNLDSEPQPDALAFIPPQHGGQVSIVEGKIVEGAPELVVEVASSSVSIDMHRKLRDYRNNGVREYVIWLVQDQEIIWFSLRDREYYPMELDSEGLYRSQAMPGLVLDPQALISDNLQKLIADQNRQLGTDAHSRFVNWLAGE